MDPRFFDAVDRLEGNDIRVSIWGGFAPAGVVLAHAEAMRHPERITLREQMMEPRSVLAAARIFSIHCGANITK